MEFSKRLYELRKQKGLSQEELAGKLNVSRQTLSKWELGESTPDMEKLVLISDYFNVSLDTLVLGKEQENPQVVSKENSFAKLLDERVLTEDNKKKTKKGLKIFGIILAVFLAIDFLSMLIYFIACGIPE